MKTFNTNRLRNKFRDTMQEGLAPIPAEIEILRADRSEYNESNGKDMAGCIAKAGSVIAYFPTQSALRSAPLYASAPDLLDALDWALRQIEDDLDPDHQAAFDAACFTLAKAKGESK